MKKILVIGGNGFVGTNLLKKLKINTESSEIFCGDLNENNSDNRRDNRNNRNNRDNRKKTRRGRPSGGARRGRCARHDGFSGHRRRPEKGTPFFPGGKREDPA